MSKRAPTTEAESISLPDTVRVRVRVTGFDGRDGYRRAGLTLTRGWVEHAVTPAQLTTLEADHRIQIQRGA